MTLTKEKGGIETPRPKNDFIKLILSAVGIFILISIIALIIFVSFFGTNNNSGTSSSNPSQSYNSTQSVCGDLASIKKQAQSIDFKKLDKNPDSFNGTTAKFTGQVFQIQESDSGGYMRLSVTKEPYGWSLNDILYVEYSGNSDAVKDDVVTVYGTLTGSKTYESLIHAQITIPSMSACVIEKASSKTQPSTAKSPTSHQQSQPSPTPPPAAPVTQAQSSKISLVSSRLYQDRIYTYLEGEVKNISDQQLKYVEANAVFKDQSGNFINSDYSYLNLNSLLPGQSSTFKISESDKPSIAQAELSFSGRVGSSLEDVALSSKTNVALAAAAPPPSSAPKSWHTVASFSGSGNKNTDAFTIQGTQWRVNWTAIATNSYCLSSGCLFDVGVVDPSKGYSVDSFSRSDISGTKNDVNNFYKNGTFYLKIIGSNIDSWQLTTEDYY